MFDFAWSEIALIGVVALIAIGPKDMPVAIKGISDTIKKLRRMAGEFQHHVDDMMKDADLGDVKSSIDELRSLNLKRTVQRSIDPDGTLARAFDDPFKDRAVPPVIVAGGPVMTPLAPGRIIEEKQVATLGPPVPGEAPEPPAFIPPGVAAAARPGEAPAFIPPEAARNVTGGG